MCAGPFTPYANALHTVNEPQRGPERRVGSAGVLNSLVPGSSTALEDRLTTGREGYVQPGIFLYYDFLLKKFRSLLLQMLKKCTCFFVQNKINKTPQFLQRFFILFSVKLKVYNNVHNQ